MSDNRIPSWRHVRREFLFALALSLFALFIYSIFSQSLPAGFRSAELKFTDASARGLAIVPASCPSSPHYDNECEGGERASTYCTISVSGVNDERAAGRTLSWTANTAFGIFTLTSSGRIDPDIGPVSVSGSQLVSPPFSTLYTYSGTQSLFGLPVRSFSCSVFVRMPTGLPPGSERGSDACAGGYYCADNSLYYRTSCRAAGQLIQTCAYGCSGGACLAPPPPSGSIRAVPSLVRKEDRTQISWSAANVSSCSVSGNNGDSWTGASGSQFSSAIIAQTVYTLSCTGLDGSTFVQSTIVNLIPIFQET